MNNIFFVDNKTNEVFDSYYMQTPWKFEVGQVFNGYWGCTSTVTKVELDMNYDDCGLIVIQKVWVNKLPILL